MCRMSRFIAFISLLTVTAFAAADEELSLRAVQAGKPQFLVLDSGRIVHGQLTPRPGGYDVRRATGQLFVPSQQIRFAAKSMDDAYQKMRDSIPDLTPQTHLEMARWCLTNRMQGKARREVLDALHLDPYNDSARQMLEDIIRNEERVSISVGQDDATKTSMLEASPDRRSLGGLPVEAAQTFTRRIQPLISNKCSNARCHGGNRSSFVITPMRTNSTSHVAEINLAAVLNQIDLAEPLKSPLLKIPESPHGGSSQLLFSGRSGRIQTQLLQSWVLDVARELSPDSETLTRSISGDASVATGNGHVAPSDPAATDTAADFDADQQFLVKARAATRHDEFDPSQFNRRFHSQK